MSDHIEPPRFFEKSNMTGKEWAYRRLGGGAFEITKRGARCEICSLKFGKDIFKSVRVRYQTFIDKQGKQRQEFSWLSTKCICLTCIVYKSGHTSINPAPWYAERVKIFDNPQSIPDDIHLRIS